MDIHRPIVTYAAVSAFALHTEEGRASLVSQDRRRRSLALRLELIPLPLSTRQHKKVMVIHSKFNPLATEDGKKFSFLGGSVETMEEVSIVPVSSMPLRSSNADSPSLWDLTAHRSPLIR